MFEQALYAFTDTLERAVTGMGQFMDWLTTPLLTLNGSNFTPLLIFGVPALIAIIAWTLIHFLNPAS